ncbi:alanine racemase [Weissella coleopterorum]|uniref:alanine racemase n=1 Tax=Weissella coleopterorum TaxID=2714949 RepID=UPI002483E746|nr:alanine racemase [Weissella coleopterorum]
MIFGNGIDIQEISAVEELALRQPNFIQKILTPTEIDLYADKSGKHQAEFLAGRYAAKEAYSKALGTGLGAEVNWQQLEVLNDEHGKPYFKMHPRHNDLIVHLSISHSGNLVKTEVLLENFPNTEIPISTHRSAWIEVSQAAVAHNIKMVKEISGAKRFMAILKANAYGHGMPQMVEAARNGGADAFGVATLDEAIWLRHFGVQEPVLVLGIIEPEQVQLARQHQIIVPVANLAWLNAAQKWLPDEVGGSPLLIALAVDTGMTRIGIRTAVELDQTLKTINADQRLKLHSIGMHFATADTKNEAYFEKQLARWHVLTDDLDLPEGIWRHLANSGTALWHSNPSTDVIRIGAAMYGFDSSQGNLAHRDLKPVLSLKAKLVQVKQVEAGISVSYGATYTTKDKTWIGTVPLGYADGYLRKLQGATLSYQMGVMWK